MTKKLQTLNQSQFADHIGVHKSYVTELKQAGRLVFAENGKVDVEASKLLIKQTADANRDDVGARHAQNRGAVENKNPPASLAMHERVGTSLQNSRAIKENYQARTAKMEYEKAIGELISLQDAKIWAADIGEFFRSSLENLAVGLAAELAMQNTAYIKAHLVEVHAEILNNLSKKIEKGLNDAY